MAKALTLIKAISKKKKSVVDTLKVEFIEGATKKGIKPEVAEQVYATIEPFAGYGFNKAHTTAYAFLAYRTAYLKAHYPREFMAALMTSEMANTDKIAECREECADLGIELLPPDVNRSRGEFAVDGDAIRYGLAAVKNVGGRSVDAILHERDANGQFTSLFDLCRRIDLHNVNKSVIESLIKAGAMDGFTVPRARLAAGIDRALDAGNQAQADRQKKQMSLFDALSPKDDFRADFEQLPDVPEWPENVLLTNEKDVIGFYLSKHPLASHRQMLQRFSTAKLADLRSLPDGTDVVIGGLVVNPIVRVIQTGPNEGQQMGKFTLDDASGSCEAVLFSDQFKRHGHLMKADSIVFAEGKVSLRNAAPSLRVSKIVSIGAARAELTDHVTITIAPGHQHADILPRLREVIDHHQGECPVYFRVASDGPATLVRAGAHWRVAPSESFEYAICGLLGEGSLEYTPRIAPPRPEAVRATSASAPPPPMAAFAEDLDITVEEEEPAF
jgi:DNA polymerase-3 subunit alpha